MLRCAEGCPGADAGGGAILAASGVDALTVGCNGAGAPPGVPKNQPFIWRDVRTGTEIFAMWHAGPSACPPRMPYCFSSLASSFFYFFSVSYLRFFHTTDTTTVSDTCTASYTLSLGLGPKENILRTCLACRWIQWGACGGAQYPVHVAFPRFESVRGGHV